ncbi:MAG: AbrB family transcriptional regulator [Mitsuokella sp.]|uniref:AbrB family transcriptional regulator n=1 Tax=Mitsuokella sp. TaxID=2049034 RepID=UPI003D7E12FE
MDKMTVKIPDTSITEHGSVRTVNSAVYAMQMLRTEMAGEGEKTGLVSEDDVNAAVKDIRSESE